VRGRERKIERFLPVSIVTTWPVDRAREPGVDRLFWQGSFSMPWRAQVVVD